MKEVVIDNSQELVIVDGKVIPRLLLRMIRGGVGKSYVVKQYKGRRMVVTHFPDMSGIVPTEKQKVRRDLFREAVVWAKWVIVDEQRKLAFRNTLPRKKRKKVYQAALQMYMRNKGNKLWVSRLLAVMAVVGVKRERLKVNGGYEQQGPWRVMWKKRTVGIEVLGQEVTEESMAKLQI